jgi:hypothetical protein
MSYFKKFPRIEYTFDNGLTSKVAVDILTRVGFKSKVKNTSEMFSDYDIEEGETPEVLADRYYGDSELHWVILIMNEIINPYDDWPVSTRVLNKSIDSVKYPGTALILTDKDGTGDVANVSYTKDDQIYVVTGNTWEVNAEGTVVGLSAGDTAAIIHKWDKTFQKLEVVGVSGSFAVGEKITTIGITGDGSYVYTVSNIGRVVTENRASAHHFADITGDFLNPYGTPPSAGTGDQTLLGQQGSFSGGYTVEYEHTILQNYAVDSVDTYTVTNYEYEEEQNESKRSIKLLKPQFINAVVQEFEKVIKQ